MRIDIFCPSPIFGESVQFCHMSPTVIAPKMKIELTGVLLSSILRAVPSYCIAIEIRSAGKMY